MRFNAATRRRSRRLLPEYAALIASDRPDDRFDALVIDEAQDLLTNNKLDALEQMLHGGLRNGRWYAFLDKERQAEVYQHFEQSALERLSASAPRFHLSQQLPQHIRDRGRHRVALRRRALPANARGGDPVVFSAYRQSSGWAKALHLVATGLRDAGVSPGRVSVLLVNKPKDEDSERLTKMGIRRLTETDIPKLGTPALDDITWATVAGFKGLENDVIVLTGVEEPPKRLVPLAGLRRHVTRSLSAARHPSEESDRVRRERERRSGRAHHDFDIPL